MKPHSSHAQNPLIAQVMYFGKYLETWGRGIELMKEQCEEVHVAAPQFCVEAGCFRVTFLRTDSVAAQAGVQEGDKKRVQGGIAGVQQRGTTGEQLLNLSETDRLILELMTQNPSVSVSAIAQKNKLTRKNTYKHISSLQEKNLVAREGPKYGGIWKVLI